MQRIKIVDPEGGLAKTECYINDKKLDCVRSVDFHVGVGEIPTFTFETMGFPNIDALGMVRFDFTPETVQHAVEILRNELLKHGDLYNGFLASIKSSIDEHLSSVSANEFAENILKRIIGED